MNLISTKISQVNWEFELQKAAFNYHVIIATVALILNPIFIIGDYFTIPAHFFDFFYFRIAISLFTLIVLLNKKKFENRPEIIALVPFLGISIQNAYMYSVMDVIELQKHTFSYITLFIGAGMFVLWEMKYTIFIVFITLISNILFFLCLGNLTIDEILTNGGLLTLSVALFSILLIQTRTKLTKKEIISRLELAKINEVLSQKNDIIEHQNSEIISSINYAKRILSAILPEIELINSYFSDSFIFFQPKDIVSGDFYWFTKVNTTPNSNETPEELIVISAVDCTGHGVPGALMSIIGNTILNHSLTVPSINTPADALCYLDQQIIKNLNSINDGMDIALVALNLTKLELQYAGANNPLYIIRNKELIILKADKNAIGGNLDFKQNKTFTNHKFNLKKGDALYLFTDGYADQFGGLETLNGGKKFKYDRFKKLLIEINDLTMEQQKKHLIEEHKDWKGKLEQVDDILIIGFRI
jgi:sigma-B regulation protein RsbU (phosphoserine phosphatase)